jgi:glycolate oxidase iron-sulfur subunit
MSKETLAKTIQQHANQCVKCGLCLPHCPTYAITENECESPRGRIALLDALAKQQIPLSAKTDLYLDHCLTCRACEAVCPAKVSYGELIDQGREFLLAQNKQKKPLPLSLDFFLKHPYLWRLFARLVPLYQKTGLQAVIRKSGLLKMFGLQRAEALLPASIKYYPWRTFYAAQTTQRGQVALFTGCVNQMIDAITIKAAITLLTACGYDVHIPAQQQCCGALHRHAGAQQQAQIFAKKNIATFNKFNINSIVTITTGCAATLQDYTLKLPIVDINQFLLSIVWPKHLILKPLAKRVAVHIPCTLRNVLKQPHTPNQLLTYIPDLEIISLSAQPSCCGAAGAYMLQHTDMADDLLAKTLQQIIPLNPDYLATANIGCALHLQRGLAQNRLKTRVLHPIVLLAEQLDTL